MSGLLNASKHIEVFLKMVDYCQENISVVRECYETENKRQQDLLHEIEFCNNAKERSKLATKLHQVRIDRRYWKDLYEEMKIVVDSYLCSNSEGQRYNRMLKEVLGSCRKIEQYHDKRTYKKRALPENQ